MQIEYPLLAMVILTLLVTWRLGVINIRASKNEQVKLKQFRLFDADLPQEIQAARQHYKNLFEMPVLFYVLCLAIIATNIESQFAVINAWVFVAFRYLHSWSRIGNRNVIVRFYLFTASMISLGIGWLHFAISSLN